MTTKQARPILTSLYSFAFWTMRPFLRCVPFLFLPFSFFSLPRSRTSEKKRDDSPKASLYRCWLGPHLKAKNRERCGCPCKTGDRQTEEHKMGTQRFFLLLLEDAPFSRRDHSDAERKEKQQECVVFYLNEDTYSTCKWCCCRHWTASLFWEFVPSAIMVCPAPIKRVFFFLSRVFSWKQAF